MSWWRVIALCWLLGVGAARAAVLDDMRQPGLWRAIASDQVQARLQPGGGNGERASLCLHYDFAGVSGYAVMRRELPIDWPEHFELSARLHGSAALNDLQIKFVDASGDNVWWIARPNYPLPPRSTELRFKRRHIDFAWGPTADRRLRRTQAVEFVIAAGRDGGRGRLCLSQLALRPIDAPPAVWPALQVRQQGRLLDHDFGVPREFNGITLQWPAGAQGLDYELLGSTDGRRYTLLRRVRGSDGGLDALFLPESEARHLRLRLPAGVAAPQLALKTAAEWPNFNAMLSTLARHAPRGDLPRAFLGQQNYWALVGVDGGGPRSGLLSEDGAIEVGRGGFSLEPALQLEDGSLLTWAGAERIEHSLPDGQLPLPQLRWQAGDLALTIATAADGPPARPELLARYTLHNRGPRERSVTMLLALRPWQVNPPQQFLTTPGGARPIERISRQGAALRVDGSTLRFSTAPTAFGAAALDGGVSLQALQRAADAPVHDPQRHASALLQWRITLPAGGQKSLSWVAPLAGGAVAPASDAQVAQRIQAATDQWRARLERVPLQLPGDGERVTQSLRMALAHILISRDGPSLRPGTRSYNRSWIRDGAMMVAGLLRLGEIEAARQFADWFEPFIFASGKVPCCVDSRGADPVVENDSHGQYLFTVAEILRHGGGRAWAERHWPQVQRVVAWMEALRQSERGAANREPGRRHYFGLMPPSISHEGYSDKPAYSNWDNFWALRGYKDAVLIAQALGQPELAARWAGWRDEFEAELQASIAASMQVHGIGFIPGAADRGDFDATSTTIALNPAQAALPRAWLLATFERYWLEMDARSRGQRSWRDYTPYELRTVGALTRLGQPERAHAMLDFFFRHQRPAGWHQWAEVVLPDEREPRFLGDMPHAWVASDYIRSALDLIAFDDEGAGALILGAGLKPAWLQQGDIRLQGLATAFGRLDLALLRRPEGWRLELGSALQGLPGLRGGVVLRWPEGLPLPRALHAGRELPWAGRDLRLPAGPATVELLHP